VARARRCSSVTSSREAFSGRLRTTFFDKGNVRGEKAVITRSEVAMPPFAAQKTRNPNQASAWGDFATDYLVG
jgi:hypothetical protein